MSPGNGEKVIAIQNNACTITRNSDPTQSFFQLVYNIAYRNELGFVSPDQVSSIPYQYVIPGTADFVQISDQRTRLWSPATPAEPIIHENECMNVFARWCGDGLISNSETCDPADPSKTAWGTNGCSAACQPLEG